MFLQVGSLHYFRNLFPERLAEALRLVAAVQRVAGADSQAREWVAALRRDPRPAEPVRERNAAPAPAK